MGSIVSRKRKDGSTIGHTAQIRLKDGGKVIFTESQTFDRKPAAQAWLKKRETELAQPGALVKPTDPTLADVIDKYNEDKLRPHGKTKDQVLRTIKNSYLGELRCSEIKSHTLVEYIQTLKSQPQTRGNYLSHLASVFSVARPAWGYPAGQRRDRRCPSRGRQAGVNQPVQAAHQAPHAGRAGQAAEVLQRL